MHIAQCFPYEIEKTAIMTETAVNGGKNSGRVSGQVDIFCLPECENANDVLSISLSAQARLAYYDEGERNNVCEKIFISNFSESEVKVVLTHSFFGVEKSFFMIPSGEYVTFHFSTQLQIWFITK